MADTANGSPADGQISSKQWEQIKEKLKTSWHRNDPSPFDKVSKRLKMCLLSSARGGKTFCKISRSPGRAHRAFPWKLIQLTCYTSFRLLFYPLISLMS